MKNKLIILLLFLSGIVYGQSVPNTNTFHLTDVTAVVGGNSLTQCFTNSIDNYFDPVYKGAKDRLSNFRNYTMPQYPSGKWVTAVVYGGVIFRSNDYGATWSQEATSQYWRGVDMDSSGMYQTAVVYDGYIYASNDFGVTWSQRALSKYWAAISLSSDGKYQTAVVWGGYIYVSSNYGLDWTQEGVSKDWKSIDVSPTGKYQVAGVDGGYVWISTDYGITWTLLSPALSTSYGAVFVSKNGASYTAAANATDGGYIYISTDGGATWAIEENVLHHWASLSGDNSGTYRIAGDANGTSWYTSFTGWVSTGPDGDWRVASGYNGSFMYKAAVGGSIWVSKDYGITWVEIYAQALTLQWIGIATN